MLKNVKIACQANSRKRNVFQKTHCTLLFDSKVDNCCFGGDFRSVVWITKFGCDVKSELRVIFNLLLSDTDHVGTT